MPHHPHDKTHAGVTKHKHHTRSKGAVGDATDGVDDPHWTTLRELMLKPGPYAKVTDGKAIEFLAGMAKDYHDTGEGALRKIVERKTEEIMKASNEVKKNVSDKAGLGNFLVDTIEALVDIGQPKTMSKSQLKLMRGKMFADIKHTIDKEKSSVEQHKAQFPVLGDLSREFDSFLQECEEDHPRKKDDLVHANRVLGRLWLSVLISGLRWTFGKQQQSTAAKELGRRRAEATHVSARFDSLGEGHSRISPRTASRYEVAHRWI